jgi:hypothetical protein
LNSFEVTLDCGDRGRTADSIHVRIDPSAGKVATMVAEPDRSKGVATAKFAVTSGRSLGHPPNLASGGIFTIVFDAKSHDSGNPFRDDDL